VLAVSPLITTVLPPTVPLPIETTPDPSEVKFCDNDLILTKVPAPLFISGFVSGKLSSFAIGTKPPTSSTRSIILASIAAVVATLLSAEVQVSPDCISSALSKL
jgi:hypothetical protein